MCAILFQMLQKSLKVRKSVVFTILCSGVLGRWRAKWSHKFEDLNSVIEKEAQLQLSVSTYEHTFMHVLTPHTYAYTHINTQTQFQYFLQMYYGANTSRIDPTGLSHRKQHIYNLLSMQSFTLWIWKNILPREIHLFAGFFLYGFIVNSCMRFRFKSPRSQRPC